MVVFIFVMTAQVDFLNQIKRVGVDIGAWVIAQIGGRDEDVVHVQKQPAAGASRDLSQEFGLFDRAFLKRQVRRWVFQQHLAADGVLQLVDMIGHAVQGGLRIG